MNTEPAEGFAVNAELVRRGDLDELIRHVDRLGDAAQWAELDDLRHRCRIAFDTGRQLWPAASLAQYRLALLAPAEWAAAAVLGGDARFAPGPLTEVAASTHTWDALAPHLPWGPESALLAHERAVRADAGVAGIEPPGPPLFDLPLTLQPWEPCYEVATYRSNRVEAPAPDLPPPRSVTLPATAPRPFEDPASLDALRDLARAWTVTSTGASAAAAVEGTAAGALALLGVSEARVAEVDAATVLSVMAWTAASGGAHGRRRGAAVGRADAWWALASLGGLADEWPVAPDELGDVAADLRWYVWDEGAPTTGWALRLAVEDPAEHLAWALSATDRAETG